MKIKLFLSTLLVSLIFAFIVPVDKVFAFDQVQYHNNGGLVDSFMDSAYANDDFHIPPSSDDSTTLVYYFSLPYYNFGYEGGRFIFYFYDMPKMIFNSSSTTLSYVYTYDLDLVVAGQEYDLSGTYTIDGSTQKYPTLQSAPVYDFYGHVYLKYTVHLTYTNMGNEAVIGDFDLKVPAFDMQIEPIGYNNPIYYLESLSRNLVSQLSDLKETVISKFDDMFDQMEEQHNELLNGFDDSTGNQINSDFNDTVADLDQAEDNLFALAENQINYSSYEDFFRLSSIEGAIAFVSSWMQSLYVSLGVFGMPILIGLIMIVVTRIIGYQNFSAGGG